MIAEDFTARLPSLRCSRTSSTWAGQVSRVFTARRSVGLFLEADADGSGGLDRREFRSVIRQAELGLTTS